MKLPQRAAASKTNSAFALGNFLRRFGMTSCYARSNNLGIAAKKFATYISPNAAPLARKNAMDARAKTGVSIRSAGKRYGPVVALDDVSLDIAPGEFVSLLSRRARGKTTLLGILGGFVQPSSGAVCRSARMTLHLRRRIRRNIGIVFQNYALFPHMTVGENVAFPLRARASRKRGWAKKVADALAMVELSGFEARNISQLSGGQRQRVALARAMVFEPQLILMDEPLSALDKQLRETMQIELRASAPQARRDDRLRDARSARGAHHERPRRGAEERQARADRCRRSVCTTGLAMRSSRASSARRRCST